MFIGFWRPIFLSPACGQGKETEEQHFVQQIDNRSEYIQQKLPKDFIFSVNIWKNSNQSLYQESLRQYPGPMNLWTQHTIVLKAMIYYSEMIQNKIKLMKGKGIRI